MTAGEEGVNEDLSVKFKSFLKPRNKEELIAAAVTAKVDDGNIRAAIRLLCSEEKAASDVKATYEKLLERHPEPPIDRGQAKSPDDIAAM
jgi:hypothetical protein